MTKHNDSHQSIFINRGQRRRLMLRAWVADESFRKFKLIRNGIEDLRVRLYRTPVKLLLRLSLDLRC